MAGAKGYPLDGHINRVLCGKTIENVTKDGRMLAIQCTTGEIFRIAWATPNGVGVEGEPCLVKVDVSLIVPSAGIVGAAKAI